jgi:hypothetical protein
LTQQRSWMLTAKPEHLHSSKDPNDHIKENSMYWNLKGDEFHLRYSSLAYDNYWI